MGVRTRRLEQRGAEAERGLPLEVVDDEDALDHVGRNLVADTTLEGDRDDGTPRIAPNRTSGAGDAGRAAEGRHHQTAGPCGSPEPPGRICEPQHRSPIAGLARRGSFGYSTHEAHLRRGV